MNDNVKKIVLAIVVILILVAGFIFLGKKPVNNQNNLNEQNSVTEQKGPNEEMPFFVLGKVDKIEGQKITITVGSEQKTVTLTADAVFTKQVKDKDAYKNIEAKIGDIKVGTQIVAYYTSNEGSEYIANKIQILPF